MSTRADLPCRPANRTKFIAVVGVVAVLLLGALASAAADFLASNNFTIEEQWVFGL